MANSKITDWEDVPISNKSNEITDWEDIQPEQEQSFLSKFGHGITASIPAIAGIGAGILATPETMGAATIPAAALGYAGGKELENIANKYLFDENQVSQTPLEHAKRVGGNILEGASQEMAGQSLGAVLPGVVDLVGRGVNKVSSSLGNLAEKQAIKSLNSTPAQLTKELGSEEAKKEAGRYLLDNNLVQFGDDIAKINQRVADKIEESGVHLDKIIKTMDEAGITVDINSIKQKLNERINELSKNAAKGDVIRKLKSIVGDIDATLTPAELAGTSRLEPSITPSLSEETKRDFNKMAKNWNDPEKGEAGKEAYQAYRQGTEQAAWEDLNKFGQNTIIDEIPVEQALIQSKKDYSNLAPLEELSTKGAQRAETQSQNVLNLKDLLIGGGLGATLGPLSGTAAVVAKHVIVPRLSSSGAVTADFISKLIKTSPDKLGQFAQPLANAISRGGNSFGATHYILQNSSPEYRQKLKDLEGENE